MLYGDDLARIHVEGYAFFCESAAPWLLERLAARLRPGSRVLDLGCGGGQWLEALEREGYKTFGVDASPAMIRAARRRVPKAKLTRGSFASVKLPSCDAATSIGEPLNYLKSGAEIRSVMKRVFDALEPGGLFVFDLREPPDEDVPARVHSRVEEDWAIFTVIHERPRKRALVREITTFTKHGPTYRRDEEIHRLRVFPRSETLKWLRSIGFKVRTHRGYGDYALTARQTVYVARKP